MSEAASDILIFGAGFGTRMAPLTDTMPKPLVPVAGKALIDHALDLAREEGLNPHVNAHYRAAQMRDHLPADVTLHIESPDILETGGGLKAALPLMTGDPVATLNSDAIWRGPNPIRQLREAWRAEMDALVLLVPLAQTVGFKGSGDFQRDAQGRISRSKDGAVYTGAQLVRRSVFDNVTDRIFSLNVIWDRLLERGTLFGIDYPGHWADVGTPAGIPLAEKMLRDV